ncbi:MAG TPA: FAD-dependent oxidoreductase, partial [Puia sp.]|nr:FAD-dependent oxidoreductase [Puia sp.]
MKLIVIGNGMAGYKFCEKLVTRSPGQFEITVFGEEPRPAYDRVHLSAFFAGKTAEDLSLAPADWYSANGIVLHLADPVIGIDRETRTVHSFKGVVCYYDILVFATGSAAFIPSIPGIDKQGVFIYRTIEDLEMIGSFAQHINKATVIGGGLLGLEAAKALLDLGVRDTQVIEYASRLMPKQIDSAGSRILSAKLADLGLSVYTNSSTTAVLGNEWISGLQFANGEKLETEMLVISAGIRPRDELAGLCGLQTGNRGGIVVNDLLQTSDPSIYAIGECALHRDVIYGLVAPGYEMAEVLASNLCGLPGNAQKFFTGFDMSTKLKL